MLESPASAGRPDSPQPAVFSWIEEANRQLTICNACRYCEAYCPVFPALERRTILADADVVSLANLCHDCQACYQACMYVPPHEFAVNLPAVLTAVRQETYSRYAWPGRVARWFQGRGWAPLGLAAVAVLIFAVSLTLAGGWAQFFQANGSRGAFYRVVPFLAMLIPALVGGAFIFVVLWGGFLNFWRASKAPLGDLLIWPAWVEAIGDALRLTHMRGGGEGCYYPDPFRPSGARRVLHSLVVWGFVGTFVSTTLAGIWQDFLHQTPPFPVWSAPVLFGIGGGVALIAGTSGLIYLKLHNVPAAATTTMRSMDYAFLATLDAAAITGMLTLILRDSSLLGVSLDLHIACLFALYVTAPYGKFVHFVYRFAAILLDAVERRQKPVPLPLAEPS